MKKFWALLLAALLVVSILPVSALAADVPEPTPAFEQGTLTINVAFNGLPEDKIPESVKWGLKKDGAHVQDVVITAAEKWTKSLTLDPGEYELHADVDSADVGGYYHFYYSIIWATVTAGEDTKLDITETYEVQPVMSFDIPVEKKVELLGKSAPLTDTDFDFAFTLANDAGKTDMLKLYFDGKPVTDSFTMTVKAGETSVAGVLTVSGPVSQMYGLHGTLSEKAPAETANWLYDSSEYRFGVNIASPLSVLEEEPRGEKLPAYITLDDENVDAAVFTNKYSVTTGTLTVTKSFEGLPKELIPASVTFELWQDKQHLEGQDITLTAADGWTKSVELEAGEYILKALASTVILWAPLRISRLLSQLKRHRQSRSSTPTSPNRYTASASPLRSRSSRQESTCRLPTRPLISRLSCPSRQVSWIRSKPASTARPLLMASP